LFEQSLSCFIVLDKPNGKHGFGGEGSPVENHTCVLGPFDKYLDFDLEILDHVE
jgi:hypothetical protein